PALEKRRHLFLQFASGGGSLRGGRHISFLEDVQEREVTRAQAGECRRLSTGAWPASGAADESQHLLVNLINCRRERSFAELLPHCLELLTYVVGFLHRWGKGEQYRIELQGKLELL